jgi:hypothetical protein
MMDKKHIMPKKLKVFIEDTYVPEQEEVEESMDHINDVKNEDDQYFNNYNNLLFL